MRQQKEIKLKSVTGFKNQLLSWSQQFEEIVWLDSNQCIQSHASYDAVLAVDAFTGIQTDLNNGFDKLKEYQAVSYTHLTLPTTPYV